MFSPLSVEFAVKQVVRGDLNLLIVIDLILSVHLSQAASFDILVINVVLAKSLFCLVRRNFINVLIVSFGHFSVSEVFVVTRG